MTPVPDPFTAVADENRRAAGVTDEEIAALMEQIHRPGGTADDTPTVDALGAARKAAEMYAANAAAWGADEEGELDDEQMRETLDGALAAVTAFSTLAVAEALSTIVRRGATSYARR